MKYRIPRKLKKKLKRGFDKKLKFRDIAMIIYKVQNNAQHSGLKLKHKLKVN